MTVLPHQMDDSHHKDRLVRYHNPTQRGEFGCEAKSVAFMT